MVKLQVSKGNNPEHEFLYETTVEKSIDDLTREITQVFNQKLQVQRLAAAVRQLAMYGPMKPENERGLSEQQIELQIQNDQKVNTNEDPTGIRVGVASEGNVREVLVRTANEAESLVSVKQVAQNKLMKVSEIEEAVRNIRGAVMMAYPMNLPEYDEVRMILDGKEDLSGKDASKDVLDEETTVMWFAGKIMQRDHQLKKYVGNNEKTKIKVKLSKSATQAPQREPRMDEDTKKKMMAMWYKKQEEQKRMAEEEDTTHDMSADWANPHSFRQHVQGLSQIKFLPN